MVEDSTALYHTLQECEYFPCQVLGRISILEFRTFILQGELQMSIAHFEQFEAGPSSGRLAAVSP